MDILTSLYVLTAALLLDLCLGDPHFLPHPVRWMGKAIDRFEPLFRKLPMSATHSGAVFANPGNEHLVPYCIAAFRCSGFPPCGEDLF